MYWRYPAPGGEFRIIYSPKQSKYLAFYNDDELDKYSDPHQAAYEIANDLTSLPLLPSNQLASACNIPEELDNWIRVK